jgi:hypothetical protein
MAEKIVSGEEYQAMSRKSPKPGHEVSLPAKTVGVVILVVILCGISFFVGKNYGKDHAKTTTAAASTFSGRAGGGYGGGGGVRNGGGFGQATAVSSSSITVQNPRSGTSTTYAITSSTTITDNGQTISASNIQVGDTVIIRVASSGSTTATSILVNPSYGGGGVASSSGGSSTTGGSNTVGQ